MTKTTDHIEDQGSPIAPETVHEVLVAWQEGRLGWRRAVDLVGVAGLPDLYDAAASSGVTIRKTLLPREKRAVERAVAAIRKRLSDETEDEPA